MNTQPGISSDPAAFLYQCMELNDKQLKLTKHRIEVLHSLSVFTVEDLLVYYPIRYDVLNVTPYDDWRINDRISFEGEVVTRVNSWRYAGKKTVSRFDVLAFGTYIHVTVFNRPWTNRLSMNQVITITGIYKGKGQVTATSYTEKSLSETDTITPVYSTKAGIPQRTIRECIRKVMDNAGEIPDIVPEKLVMQYRLLHRCNALQMIHFPESEEDISAALRTLKYEEFLKFFTAVRLSFMSMLSGNAKQPKSIDKGKISALLENLPYETTPDQQRTIDEIVKDMSSSKAMYRLVQGEVGSGKTAVDRKSVV